MDENDYDNGYDEGFNEGYEQGHVEGQKSRQYDIDLLECRLEALEDLIRQAWNLI